MILFLFSVILVVVIAICMLLDMPRLENAIDRRFPPAGGLPLTQRIERALWVNVKGQAILSFVIGSSAGIGMWILGTTGLVEGAERYALLFGLWTAFVEVIPYIGPWFSAVPPAVYALVVDPVGVLWVAALFVFIYQIEGHVVVPNVMASALRLHPLLVIFGLLAGGALYGIPGVLVALPTMAAGRAIWKFFGEEAASRRRQARATRGRARAARRYAGAAEAVWRGSSSGQGMRPGVAGRALRAGCSTRRFELDPHVDRLLRLVLPRVELDALAEELPDGPAGGHRRQRDEHAGDAVERATREQPEDHEQRVEPKRARHDVRHHHVALDLVDEDEERGDPQDADGVDHERVDGRRDGGEPRPDVRDHLDEGRPQPEQQRVALGALDEARRAEDPHPDPGARPDHEREDRLPLDVAPQGALDPLGQRQPASGRNRRSIAFSRRGMSSSM